MRAWLTAVFLILGLSLSEPTTRGEAAVPGPADAPANRQASQFTLRFRCVGYEDVVVPRGPGPALPPDDERFFPRGEEPPEEVLRELTIPVTIGLPFKGESRIDRKIFSLSGTATPSKEGRFVLEIKCVDVMETDDTAIDELGREIPLTVGTEFNTTFAVMLGKEDRVGGSGTITQDSRTDAAKERLMTKTSYRVRLDRYTPKKTVKPSSARCASARSRGGESSAGGRRGASLRRIRRFR